MFAPGVPDIMADFNSTNPNLATFVVSVYVLGFAFGPLLAAPMSETYGRAICYNIANVAFVIFTIGTALSQNMGMLIGFRFLMGFAGSTPITNGGGSVADMFPVEQRGKAMSIWAMGPILGPCVGPVAGGYISQSLGWRWVFWIIAIAVRYPVACIIRRSTDYCRLVLYPLRASSSSQRPTIRPLSPGKSNVCAKRLATMPYTRLFRIAH